MSYIRDRMHGAHEGATNFWCCAAAAAIAAASIAAPPPAAAQDHGTSHDSQHDSGGHDSGGHESGGQQSGSGQGGRQGQNPATSADMRGHQSMEDIFRSVAEAADEEGDDSDSDRPDWAGGGGGRNDRGEPPGTAGSTRGDLYGDLWVILRDDDGVPIVNDDGFVQPLDAEGNPIPLDEEGAPIDPSLVVEVELSRLNVSRSPTSVLDTRADEVISLLSTAVEISTDPSGRLVVTSPDGTVKTIDAPLENLALYVALMSDGTIPGVSDLPGTDYDFLVDGELTAQDMEVAASLLAGASDKLTSLSLDAVAYINAILGIDLQTQGGISWSDVDYDDYSYDRSDTYADVTATVLVPQDDGSFIVEDVNIFVAVFGSEDYAASGTLEAFAQAADDAREVIAFLHEYEIPATEPTPSE